MKLFIVTCLKEFQDNVSKIFKDAGIQVFSATPVIGFRNDQPMNILDSWFAAGEEKMDSLMLFSFTGEENANQAMDLIKKFNNRNETPFPLRAFIIPVENASS